MALCDKYSDSAITTQQISLGSEIKLFGLLNIINRRDSKASPLFSFSATFPPYFPIFAFTSEMI